MNTLPRSLLLAGVGAALAPGLALAQFHGDAFTLNLSHPANYVTGDAQAVVLGQLTEDAIPDACVLHGTQAHLLRSVDRRNRWRALSGSYTGIALLPQGQSNGRDGVLAVDSAGLVKLLWNGSAGVETLVAQPVSGSSAWVGATSVQVVQTPSGDFQVLGIAADQQAILRWSYEPVNGAMADMGEIGAYQGTTALAAVNWNEDDELEYAVAGTWGLGVYDANGERVGEEIFLGCLGSKLLRLNDGEGANDRLVWVIAMTSIDNFVQVLHPDQAPDPSIHLAGTVEHMVLQDVGDDDLRELVLFGDGLDFGLALRRGTSKTFTGLSSIYAVKLNRAKTPVGGVWANGTGVLGSSLEAPVPAVHDLDGDGDEDLFAAGHPGGAGRAMIFLGRLVDEESYESMLGPVLRPWIDEYTVSVDPVEGTAQLEFDIPTLPPSGPASEANHVRITFWTQASNAAHLNHASEHVFDYSLPLTGNIQEPLESFPDLAALGNGWIHMEASYLTFEGNTMVASFPAFHEKIALQWFDPQEPVSFTFENGYAGNWGPPPGSGSAFVGGVGGTSGRPPSTPPSGGGG